MSTPPPRLEARSVVLGPRLRGVSLGLDPSECVVVVGPNGAGKSTLLRVLAGLERPDQGAAWLGERRVDELSPRTRAGLVAWLPQRPRLVDGLTTDDLVAAARFRFGESEQRARERGRSALARMGAEELAGRRVDRISGGELQRVLLATMLAQEAPHLLVDEPANHLDPRHQVDTYRRLGHFWRDEGCGLLLVTHDVRLAALLGPPSRVHVVGLSAGALAFATHLDDPRLPALLEELYGVPYVGPGEPGALAVRLDDLLALAQREDAR